MKRSVLHRLVGDDATAFRDTFPYKLHVQNLEGRPLALHCNALNSVEELLVTFGDPVSVWSPRNGTSKRERYGDLVQASEAYELYRSGHLIQFNGVEKWVPDLRNVLRELDEDVGLLPGTCTCSAFASTLGGGIPAHADPDPAFSIQLSGTKRWWIWAPEYGLRDEPPNNATVVDAKPGTVMFIPRGYYHTTRSGEGSFAITLDFYIPTLANWTSRLIKDALLDDSTLQGYVLSLRNDLPAANQMILRQREQILAAVDKALIHAVEGASKLAPFIADEERYEPTIQNRCTIHKAVDGVMFTIHNADSPTVVLELPLAAERFVADIVSRAEPFRMLDVFDSSDDLAIDDAIATLNGLIESGLVRRIA